MRRGGVFVFLGKVLELTVAPKFKGHLQQQHWLDFPRQRGDPRTAPRGLIEIAAEKHLPTHLALQFRVVARSVGRRHSPHMNATEWKALADNASPEERIFLKNYLAQLRRAEDPQYAETLAKRHRDMNAGQRVKRSKAKRSVKSVRVTAPKDGGGRTPAPDADTKPKTRPHETTSRIRD